MSANLLDQLPEPLPLACVQCCFGSINHRESGARGQKALDQRARDIMTAPCKKIRVDALAAEATAIFHKYRIDELPVVDAENRPVGLIDVQDILTIKVVG